VQWGANPQVTTAISKNLEIIGEETLATKFENESGNTDDTNELGLWLKLTKN
jgi:hypothetical protein